MGFGKFIGILAKEAGKTVAKEAVYGLVEENQDKVVSAIKDAVSDTIHSMVAGKESIERWAEIVTEGADKIIKETVETENLRYVGGKLKFAFSERNPQKIDVSFELYFLDSANEWQKKVATSDVYASVFTDDSLEELRVAGMIEYSIEG